MKGQRRRSSEEAAQGRVPSPAGKRVVLGITGGIAAYKAAELCRLLVKAGISVQVIMTDAATQFIAPLTLQTLSGSPVARDLFDAASEAEIGHIRLADEADLVVIAPATADAIARMAAGMANDLLTAVVLATRAPVLLAPAMNVNMWQNPLTQANLTRLIGLHKGRISTVGPDKGELACGWVGEGRLIEPAEIASEVARLLAAAPVAAEPRHTPRDSHDLTGLRVVVTAGPTHEPVDDVRFLGNRSSGKMGAALAESAAARGAEVTLVAGPGTPEAAGVRRVAFETAADLERALNDVLRGPGAAVDVVVMAAAVADFRPLARISGKLSRKKAEVALPLEPVPDLLAGLGRARQRGKLGRDGRPYLVGFAAEIGGGATLEAHAVAKLRDKRCDAIVANDVSAPGIGFGADDNQVTVFFADGTRADLARAPKRALADALWDLFGARPIAPAARKAGHA